MFTPIAKGARLTVKRLEKMIIGNKMTKQKKDIFAETLYNRKAVLAWVFTKIGKLKREVIPLKKSEQLIIKLSKFGDFQSQKF